MSLKDTLRRHRNYYTHRCSAGDYALVNATTADREVGYPGDLLSEVHYPDQQQATDALLTLMEQEILAFNQLTPAEAERLAMLVEECGEVVQVVGKILRHGYESHHPDAPDVTNRKLLMSELNDVVAVASAMGHAKDIPLKDAQGFYGMISSEVWNRKLRWTHHQ